MKTLRPHQEKAMSMLRYSLGGGNKRPMLQMATGAGKTLVAAHIVKGARAKGNRVCFVVPSISLIDQTVDAFRDEGITEIGVMQASHPLTDYSQPVQIASVQTLARRNFNRLDFKLIVVDEAHLHYKFMDKWMKAWNAVPFIGLSASPWTKGLGNHYDDLLIPVTMQELIDLGYLSPFKVFAPSHPDLSGVKTVAGDYHEGQLSTAMQEGTLVADIVTTWMRCAENRPTLVFAVDCAHAKKIQAQFQASGVSCGYVDAYTSREDRQVVADQFHAGEIQVVANVGVLVQGVDWDVRCLILARPTKSEMRFVQTVGRALRTAHGKDHAIILDHSDTHLRLGFVTDIHHAELNTGKPNESSAQERDEPLPKECSACHFLKPAKVHKCPSCGFAPEKVSAVETAAGELTELDLSGTAAQKKNNRKASDDDKSAFIGGLKSHAQKKGFKPGWVSNQYREKYGVWPRKHADADQCEPNSDVIGWIKHQNIRYAKRRRAA